MQKNPHVLKLKPTLPVIALHGKLNTNYKLVITDLLKETCTKMLINHYFKQQIKF